MSIMFLGMMVVGVIAVILVIAVGLAVTGGKNK